MTRMPYDTFEEHRNEIFDLFKAGKSIGCIAGLTGVPRIRIQHAVENACERKPALLGKRLAAQYPSQRALLVRPRWPQARLIIERCELQPRHLDDTGNRA